MNRFIILILLAAAFFPSCKEKKKFVEPSFVLNRWGRAIQNLNYREYAMCEAYPKSEPVFREMYRDYYFSDIVTVRIEDPDRKNLREDYEGNRFMHCMVSFEAGVVKRSTAKQYRIVRGDAVFIKFMEGKRAKQGWLISNRTMVSVNR